jgi:hypothetical protein
VMGVRPAAAAPRQRERVHHRPAARLQMELIKTAQHALAMHHRRRGVTAPGRRLSRHRVRRPGRRPRRHRPRRTTVGIAPVHPHRFAGQLDPRAKIPGLCPGRLIPANFDRPQEPPPPQHGHPVRPVRRRRPAARGQLTKVRRHRDDHHTVRVDQPVRLEQVPSRVKRPAQWHRQPRQVPRRIPFCDHGPRP